MAISSVNKLEWNGEILKIFSDDFLETDEISLSLKKEASDVKLEYCSKITNSKKGKYITVNVRDINFYEEGRYELSVLNNSENAVITVDESFDIDSIKTNSTYFNNIGKNISLAILNSGVIAIEVKRKVNEDKNVIIDELKVDKEFFQCSIVEADEKIKNAENVFLKLRKRDDDKVEYYKVRDINNFKVNIEQFVERNINNDNIWDVFIQAEYLDVVHIYRVCNVKLDSEERYSRCQPSIIKGKRSMTAYLSRKNEVSIEANNAKDFYNEKFVTALHNSGKNSEVNCIEFNQNIVTLRINDFTGSTADEVLILLANEYNEYNGCYVCKADGEGITFNIANLDFINEYSDSKMILAVKNGFNAEYFNLVFDKKTNTYDSNKSAFIYKKNINKMVDIKVDLNNNLEVIFKECENRNIVIDEISMNDKTLSFKLNEDISQAKEACLRLVKRKSKEFYDIKISNKQEVIVDLSEFAEIYSDKMSRWDCYIIVDYDKEALIGKVGYFNAKHLDKHNRFFDSIEGENNLVTPYLTIKYELAIVINNKIALQSEKLECETKLIKYNMQNGVISGRVLVGLKDCDNFEVNELLFKLRSKVDNLEYRIPVTIVKKKKSSMQLDFSIDLKAYTLDQFYWDVYLVFKHNEEEFYSKIKRFRHRIKRRINNSVIKDVYITEDNFMAYPYITMNGQFAITYREQGEYETKPYKIREYLAYYTYLLLKPYFAGKDIWLLYEKFAEAAQDNGFYFFEYLYKNQKNKKAYYIIKKDSPDYKNLEGMEDRVLEFMSFKYMVYMYAATLLVSSESKGHCYAWRVQKGKLKENITNKKHVFLQHGVTALKRVDYVFKKTTSNAVDLFVATSDYERNIIRNNFGYKNSEIITTGFCRWDVLKDKSTDRKEILLMPTWRNWMDDMPEEKFVESEYYKKYVGLLNSEKLNELLVKNNVILNFYIHPKFKAYIDRFSTNHENVRIYQFGEEKVNELMMRVSMAITDYSSIAWDVYYQKKPVLFYQFDVQDYYKYQGSYLDMETELFGDRSFDVDELVSQIEYYINNGFKEKQEYKDMRARYFKYVDTNNCERTYDMIRKKKRQLHGKRRKSLIVKLKKTYPARVIRKMIYS